jgi:hypothetical protein
MTEAPIRRRFGGVLRQALAAGVRRAAQSITWWL